MYCRFLESFDNKPKTLFGQKSFQTDHDIINSPV